LELFYLKDPLNFADCPTLRKTQLLDRGGQDDSSTIELDLRKGEPRVMRATLWSTEGERRRVKENVVGGMKGEDPEADTGAGITQKVGCLYFGMDFPVRITNLN